MGMAPGNSSSYVEHLLAQAVESLRTRSRRSVAPTHADGAMPAIASSTRPMNRRGRNCTVTFKMSSGLVQLYRQFAVFLGYARYSDLVEEILVKQLVKAEAPKKAKRTKSQ